MIIWSITGRELEILSDRLHPLNGARQLRIGVDGDTVKVKVNEGEWTAPLGVIEVNKPEPVAPQEHLYEKCDHCHLFVERNEDAEYLGCEHSGTTLHEFGPVIVPTTVGVLPHQTCKFCRTVRPTLYLHSHRGDAVDTLLDESHEPAPSGRKANLLTWKTYGPLPMRERFTS